MFNNFLSVFNVKIGQTLWTYDWSPRYETKSWQTAKARAFLAMHACGNIQNNSENIAGKR